MKIRKYSKLLWARNHSRICLDTILRQLSAEARLRQNILSTKHLIPSESLKKATAAFNSNAVLNSYEWFDGVKCNRSKDRDSNLRDIGVLNIEIDSLGMLHDDHVKGTEERTLKNSNKDKTK